VRDAVTVDAVRTSIAKGTVGEAYTPIHRVDIHTSDDMTRHGRASLTGPVQDRSVAR
jgi:hypothetical protein